MSSPDHYPTPWHPERSMTEDMVTPEDWADYLASDPPFVRIVAADGETVVTAHDLFVFKHGVQDRICEAANERDDLLKRIAELTKENEQLKRQAKGEL